MLDLSVHAAELRDVARRNLGDREARVLEVGCKEVIHLVLLAVALDGALSLRGGDNLVREALSLR